MTAGTGKGELNIDCFVGRQVRRGSHFWQRNVRAFCGVSPYFPVSAHR